MAKIKIKINDQEYPCMFVMGAMLLFKRETGKDVGQLGQDNLEDMLMLMWCCVKCASQAEGKEFPLDFETFCNTITPAMVSEWNAQLKETAEKKRAGKA